MVLSGAELQVLFTLIGETQPLPTATFGLHLQLRGIERDQFLVAEPL